MIGAMDNLPTKLLLVDDDEDDYIFTQDLLSEVEGAKYELEWVQTYDAALEAIVRNEHDVYILDYRLGKHDGLEILREVLRKEIKAPIILLTGQGDHKVDLEAMKAGASDYLVKGRIDAASLERSIRYSIKQKKSEEAIRKSDERLRQFLEEDLSGVYISRPAGALISCNSAFARIFGFSSPEEASKINIESLYVDLNSRSQFLEQLRDKKKLKLFESKRRKTDGTMVETVENAVGFFDEQGNLIEIMGYIIDVTGERKLEAQLRQTQKMEAVGTLAGDIAHDFNNILQLIIGFTELAMVETEETSFLHDHLSQAIQAGKRAKDLIKQILAFSHQTELKQRPVNVKLIAKEIFKLLSASLPSTIEIRRNLECDASVLADASQIHQIIMNLCTNAGHAMQEKGGLLELCLASVELDLGFAAKNPDIDPGSYLELRVSDTGDGMSPEVMERIFDPFFTTKAPGQGSGMGLAMVHGIVKSHGGTISVYSEPGRGTTFKVYLPIAKKSAKPEFEIEALPSTGSERILYIDDEKPLVDLGQKILESHGYKVTTRTSSIEALELFKVKADKFDLVVTDMTMPNMTGKELAKQINRIRPDIPIILCSGFSTNITDETAKDSGIRKFVNKPILRAELLQTIRQVLDEMISDQVPEN